MRGHERPNGCLERVGLLIRRIVPAALEHHKILEAVAARNATEARRWLDAHLDEAREVLERAYAARLR